MMDNKRRGKAAERKVAALLAAPRYPADTGGPTDLENDEICVQVKSGLRLLSSRLVAAYDAVCVDARRRGKQGLLVLVLRDGRQGVPNRVFMLREVPTK